MVEAFRERQTHDDELRRDLHFRHALAIVIGTIVGTGIYLRPASIAQLTSSPTQVFGVWLAAGLLTLCGALTYAQLAMRIGGTGGEYRYLQANLGRFPAFLFGWMRAIIGPAVLANLTVAMTVFLGDVVPMGGSWVHWPIASAPFQLTLDIGPRQMLAVAVIFGLAWVNCRGVRTAGGFQFAITSLKVVALLSVVIALFLFARTSAANTSAPNAVGGLTPITASASLLAAMVAYHGWANAAMLGGEIRSPERTLPLALIVGVCIATALYLAANAAFLHVLTIDDIATASSTRYPDAPSVASKAARIALGSGIAAALPVLFAVSAVGTAHCNLLTVPRVYYTMARDGWLPASLAKVGSSSATPNGAIFTFASIAAVFAVSGGYDRLSNMTSFSFVLFYALTTVGFLSSQRSIAPADRPKSFWLTTVVAALFLCGCVGLIVATIIRGSIETLAALLLIGAGTPIYALVEMRRRRQGTGP